MSRNRELNKPCSPDRDEKLKQYFVHILKDVSNSNKTILNIPNITEESDDEERRKALKELLQRLSSVKGENALSGEDIKRIIDFFVILYGNKPKFRHNYSDICDIVFGLLDECSPDDLDSGVPYQVNNLSYNINLICSAMNKNDSYSNSTQLQSVYKLCDHIELERTRLLHYIKQNQEIADFNKARLNLESEFQKQANELRIEFIAILGVFAAIVLAFNGAVNFSTSSISALGTQSGLRAIILMSSLVGFVLINAIAILLIFLWKMTNKNNVSLGKWPLICLLISDFFLVLVMIGSFAFGLPSIRSIFGLPV